MEKKRKRRIGKKALPLAGTKKCGETKSDIFLPCYLSFFLPVGKERKNGEGDGMKERKKNTERKERNMERKI